MTSVASVRKLLEQGIELHRVGRLLEAAEAYGKALHSEPTNADALNLLGVLMQSRGENRKAVEYFSRALESAPHLAAIHFNKANVLVELGLFDEAIASFQTATRVTPNYADAYLNLGAVHYRRAAYHHAVDAFRSVIALRPNDVRGHKNLGRSYYALEDYKAAEAAFLSALALAPQDVDIFVKLASTYAKSNQYQRAVDTIGRAIELEPKNGEHHSNRGNWLALLGRFDEAIAASEAACRCDPARAEFFFNCGNAFHAAGRFERAIEAFKKAIEINPQFLHAYINLGESLKDCGQSESALEVFDQALAIDPASPVARVNKAAVITNIGNAIDAEGNLSEAVSKFDEAISIQASTADIAKNIGTIQTNKALALLSLGRFREGWAAYRHRFTQNKPTVRRRMFSYPEWRGDDLHGKRLLLWTDQGPGDEVVYGSMIPDALAHAAACILECSPRMVPLFARSFPGVPIVAQSDPPSAQIAEFKPDVHSSVADLGEYFRPDAQSFFGRHAYLVADQNLKNKLQARYRAMAAGRTIIGIAWKSANADSGTAKSLPLGLWRDIFQIPGLFFISLQYGQVDADIASARTAGLADIFNDPEIDSMRDLDSFAAQVSAVDQVVSISNTAVHFAGALNMPVWTMVPKGKGALWYFRGGPTTPWYPSMRLFHQIVANDWSGVVGKVASELRQLSSSRVA